MGLPKVEASPASTGLPSRIGVEHSGEKSGAREEEPR